MLKVFLTGATGYIGSVVAERLLAAGHEVMGLARSDTAADVLEDRGVRVVRGDMRFEGAVSTASRAADVVIHAASTNDAQAPAVDERIRREILAAVEGTGKAFVYTSGVWVHGDTAERTVDERTPLSPAAIVAWRVGAEQEVLAAASRGVRSIVLRPAMVYGRTDGLVNQFVKSARETGAARYVGTGENHWPLVHVDDLAVAYRLAVELATAGAVYDLAHGPSVRVRDIARAASEAAGANGKTQAWPLAEARAVLGPLADALAMDQHISGAKAVKELGWSPAGPGVLASFA